MPSPNDSTHVHARCGQPWEWHTIVTLHGFLAVPLCDDEVEEMRRTGSADIPIDLPPPED